MSASPVALPRTYPRKSGNGTIDNWDCGGESDVKWFTLASKFVGFPDDGLWIKTRIRPNVVSALGLGRVKTHLSQGRTELFSQLLSPSRSCQRNRFSTTTKSETEILRASSTSEFSHSLGQKRTFHRSSRKTASPSEADVRYDQFDQRTFGLHLIQPDRQITSARPPAALKSCFCLQV